MRTSLRPGLAARVRKFSERALPRSSAEKAGPILAILTVILWVSVLGLGFQTAVTLVTVLGFLTLVIGLFSPGVGIIGVGLLSTMDAVTRNFLLTGGFLRWNSYNYWLLLVIALNLFFLIRLKDAQSRILQLFIIVLAIELLISPNQIGGLLDIFNIVAMFGLVIYFARGYQINGGLYWMGVVSGLAAALGGLFFYLHIDSLPYINPNSWGLFPLSAIFAICLAYPGAGQYRLGKPLLIILAAVNFLWIFLSGSRGNMLVALFSLFFLFMWTRQITWRLAFIIAGWVALGILSFQFAEQQEYAFMRLQKLIDPDMTLQQRTSGRSEIAAAGWRLFTQNPLGVGTGAFALRIAEIGYLNEEVAAHSGWIKVLAENGIPGIVLLSAYILSFTISGWRKRNQDLLLLGLLVSSSFGVALLSKEFEGKSLWLLAAGATVLLNSESIQHALNPGSRMATARSSLRIENLRPSVSRPQAAPRNRLRIPAAGSSQKPPASQGAPAWPERDMPAGGITIIDPPAAGPSNEQGSSQRTSRLQRPGGSRFSRKRER